MEGFCRGCLIKYDDHAELLQYTEKNRRLFVYSTGIQVKRTDSFTFQLCKDCYFNMKLSCKFKKQCRHSDKKFKNYLGLQDAGETLDFCTFLKNNDDALTIRFPPVIGASTPANQINRDEDNESTCTSIRNFMTDMMQGEEVPDREARIIREVIEEEADVLVDSLDSHWLQDDTSIDTDFRLDFSFSPFSTPRSANHGCGITPKKVTENKNDEIHYFSTKKLMGKPSNKENECVENKLNIVNEDAQDSDKLAKDYFTEAKSLDPIDFDGNLIEIDQNITVDEELYLGTRPQNYYVPTEEPPGGPTGKNIEESVPIEIEVSDIKKILGEKSEVLTKCTIDRNLENALKTGNGKEFSLDDLLVSSPLVFPDVSVPTTPTITNLLFGEKLEISGEDTCDIKIGQCIEKYEDVAGDIDLIEEYFNQTDQDKDQAIENENEEEKAIKVDQWSVEDKFDIENSICKVCSKQFSSSKALRIHSAKMHQIKISNPQKYAYKHKLRMCDVCGRGFRDDAHFYRHRKSHEEDKKTFKCERCLLTFSSQAKLDKHMVTHGKVPVKKRTSKQYVCNICGAVSNHYNNYRIHKLRHTKSYTKSCDECGKGFFRSSDLIVHMRNHTGERPFKCEYCAQAFSRRDALIKHIKLHMDERLFQCHHCDNKFIKKSDLKNHIFKSKKCILSRQKVVNIEESKNTSQVDVMYAIVTQA